MANKLSSTVFNAGPKDSLATLDVYASNGQKVINSIQALSASVGFDLAGLLGTKTSSNIASVIAASAGLVGINKDALTQRLVGISSSVKSAFSSMASSIQSGITGTFSDKAGVIEANINGTKSLVSSSDFSDLSSFGSFINAYTGNKDLYSVVDRDGLSGIVGGMVNQGSTLGIGNIFSTLTSGISDKSICNSVVEYCIPNIVDTSNVDVLHDMTTSGFGSVIGSLFPDFTRNLTRSYTRYLNGFERDPVGTWNKMMDSFSNIKANWDVFQRNPTSTALNLLDLMGASSDFKGLVAIGLDLMADNDYKKLYALAIMFPETTVEAEIHKYFPQTILTTDFKTDPSKVTLDPIVNKLLSNVIKAVVTA